MLKATDELMRESHEKLTKLNDIFKSLTAQNHQLQSKAQELLTFAARPTESNDKTLCKALMSEIS